MGSCGTTLTGPRWELAQGDELYPEVFSRIAKPPLSLYGIGDVRALQEGLAVVGARKATPYGLGCAKRFAGRAASRGIVIISGGARGCDAVAHEAALAADAPTVVFLGGGCDEVYPRENTRLFQRVIDAGGAVVSEQRWDAPPRPYMFRERNRLIAGLARATLIVEAGLPSGTFSTADEALAAGREVLAVPGALTSANSRGANRLIYQGATPVVDDETFDDQLFALFGCLRQQTAPQAADKPNAKAASRAASDSLLAALAAEPLGMEALRELALAEPDCGGKDPMTWLMVWLACAQRDGLIAQYPDGRYGPCVR